LQSTYQGQVELAIPQPVAQSQEAFLYSCQSLLQPGYRPTPMLSASLAVPLNGTEPFHPATNQPWADFASLASDSHPRTADRQARRLNARGCIVALDSMIDGARASALPWRPFHEAPGWWDRLLRRYFDQPEVASCAAWDDVITAIQENGPDTRGVIWIRREVAGEEATGHLVYAHNNQGNVVILDPVASGLAQLEGQHIRKLTLARFRRGQYPDSLVEKPWRCPARDFRSAKHKAQSWLDQHYTGQVILVDPHPSDEGPRGWLFACNTRSFITNGRPEDALLDAALVVPKDNSEPFGLPNSDPWNWYEQWSNSQSGLAMPPAPCSLEWFKRTMHALGGLIRITDHTEWPTLLAELATLPTGVRALIWVRRRDARGRESVGLLLNAAHTEQGLALVEPTIGEPATLETSGIIALHLIRYR